MVHGEVRGGGWDMLGATGVLKNLATEGIKAIPKGNQISSSPE